jgi:hypothetical protein
MLRAGPTLAPTACVRCSSLTLRSSATGHTQTDHRIGHATGLPQLPDILGEVRDGRFGFASRHRPATNRTRKGVVLSRDPPRGNYAREGSMNALRRDSFLLVTLAAATTTPALSQTVAPAVGPAAIGTPNTASIPDFSGVWAHLSWPDFEPPLVGPGPVTNRARQNGRSNIYQLVGDYTNPILKLHAAEVVKKHGELSMGGVPYPTPSNQCWPGGVPFVLWNIGMQMLQQPDKITILYSKDHEVRHVRMNQSHPTPVTPSWYGDSVGHYEGDTLVIDTVGVKIGPLQWSTCTAHRTAQLYMSWSVIGCSITKMRKRRKSGAKERFGASKVLIRALHATPTTRARGCSSNSLLRMTASSPSPGRRP